MSEAAPGPDKGGQTSGAGRGPTRLLILDEDRVEGGMLAFHLRREGLVVMLMTSPDEAIDAIAWASPDVLLVQLTGRGFDGADFLKGLGDQAIDVFALVDRPLDAGTELDALRLGVIDVLTKPLDAQTLARRLREHKPRVRRGPIPGLPDGGISGDLAIHSTIQLLQMCHRHRLNARLHVEVQGDWAVLLVRHGEVIDAEAPTAAGRDAAYQAIRSEAGTFVLLPLAGDAEELSREDVVRADLATLVGDALGRREPRSVNAQRLRDMETFVLPHVGSPRSPTTRRPGAPVEHSDTLEYQGTKHDMGSGRTEGARVKRPGEAERAKRAEASPAAAPPIEAPAPAMRKPLSELLHRPDGTKPRTGTRPMTTSPEPGRINEALKEEAGARASLQARQTLDAGFDEPTDQRAREAVPLPTEAKVTTGDAPRGGTEETRAVGPKSRQSERVQTRSAALKRVTGSHRAVVVPPKEADELEPATYPPVKRVQAPTDRMRKKSAGAAAARRDWLVIGLAIAAFALLVFVVWRVIANSGGGAPVAATPRDDPKKSPDAEVRYGAALAELSAGRQDQALVVLEELAAEPRPPDGVLGTLARLYYDTGRLTQAESMLTRLTTTSADGRAWAWLGLVRAERQDFDGALGAFARARAEALPAAIDEKVGPLESLLK